MNLNIQLWLWQCGTKCGVSGEMRAEAWRSDDGYNVLHKQFGCGKAVTDQHKDSALSGAPSLFGVVS